MVISTNFRPGKKMRLSTKILLGVSVIIVLVNVAVFLLIGRRYEVQLMQGLTDTARSFYKLIVVMRAWVAQHEGVYVRQQEGIEPNPYLDFPGISASGDTLVLRNPAWVTREVSNLSAIMGKQFRFHLTSLNPVNPDNTPDEFEREALLTITNGEREHLTRYGEFTRLESRDGVREFRYFAPLFTEESCLSCHGKQGYKVGDVRGGISIIIPTEKVDAARTQNYAFLVLGGLLASVAISLLIYFVVRGAVIQPLRQLETVAERIETGDFDGEVPVQKEDEIGDLAKAMNKMSRAIQTSISKQIETEKMFALGQLSAGIAHEIRNPLFAIGNDLDYLKRHHSGDGQQLEIYDEMEDGVARISNTVNAVLDYSKPHQAEFGRHNIREVIDRSMALLGKQLEKENIRTVLRLDDSLPAIELDIHRMEQVFVNLLTNAMQAMAGKAGEIEITATQVGEYAQICVRDNGIGIKTSLLHRIFDPFFTRSPNGTGLGLTIVRGIVEQHQGAIHVKSEEGKGATFTIKVPIEQKTRENA